MKIEFTIILTLTMFIFSYVIYKTQLSNSDRQFVLNHKIKTNETYDSKLDADKAINLDRVLDSLNSSLIIKKVNNPTEYNIFTTTNLDEKLLIESKKIVFDTLNSINELSGAKLKFNKVEQMREEKNDSEKLVTIRFYAHEIEGHFTYRMTLQYYKYNETMNLNYILHDSEKLTKYIPYSNLSFSHNTDAFRSLEDKFNLKGYQKRGYAVSPALRKRYLVESTLPDYNKDYKNLMKNCKYGEPCKYTLDEWDYNGVKKTKKMANHCKYLNNSDKVHKPYPYNNPTIYKIPFPNEIKGY